MIGSSSRLPFDERWFSTALKSIGDAVIATDEKGRVLFMNPVAEKLTGWFDGEAHGKALSEVFAITNELTGKPVDNPVAKVLATGQIIGLANHTMLTDRGGKQIPIDDSAAPIVDDKGRIAGVILVFRDVTEKRQAELLNERLAAIIDSSDDIIASKDLNGVITGWNRGAERILGYTAEEIIGKHVSMIMPPELVEDMPRILDRIRRGEKVDHYETRRRCKDGTIIDVSLTVSPIRNSQGEVIGASKVGRDITLQKLVEGERLEADRRKDEFLAMLAHELRNPIASISGAAHLFGKLETEEDLEWAKEVVLRQVKHLGRLIDDLLDVSRITRGKIDLRKEPLDLLPIVNSAIETVRSLMEERKHELTVSVSSGVTRLEADPLRLEQMLVNLLTNAAKYTESGGEIWLTARRQGENIVIKVKDTGIGITPELRPHLFDLFAQGDRSAARSEGGLGIGLTLVKSLVEMHDGTITVESEGANKGSEFTLSMPALKELVVPRRKSKVELPTVLAGLRVLVVDDNVDTAKSLARLLKLLGHDVAMADEGKAAIEVARAHRPDVVLLDIGLPGMNGYEVAAQLRQEECCKDAVIIAISCYGQEDDRRRSQHSGFDHHLVKPVEYDALMALLASRPR
jgi:PAS domain S-box-containing protein